MKYWQEDRAQKATKTNVPHLYMYTWIRASSWGATIFNSILMFFITEENSIFDKFYVREDIYCLFCVFCGLGMLSLSFSDKKVERGLIRVVLDVLIVVMVSAEYILGNQNIVFFYLFELIIMVYYSIRIEKDNNVVDNNKFVLWWKHKKKERYNKKVRERIERNRNNRIKVQMTEEEKMKRLSRHQRKQIKKQKSGR